MLEIHLTSFPFTTVLSLNCYLLSGDFCAKVILKVLSNAGDQNTFVDNVSGSFIGSFLVLLTIVFFFFESAHIFHPLLPTSHFWAPTLGNFGTNPNLFFFLMLVQFICLRSLRMFWLNVIRMNFFHIFFSKVSSLFLVFCFLSQNTPIP